MTRFPGGVPNPLADFDSGRFDPAQKKTRRASLRVSISERRVRPVQPDQLTRSRIGLPVSTSDTGRPAGFVTCIDGEMPSTFSTVADRSWGVTG